MEARLVIQRRPTLEEAPVSKETRSYLRSTGREVVGVVRREISLPEFQGADTAAIQRDSAGDYRVAFADTVPGARLFADVAWRDSIATATLRAELEPCALIDVLSSDGVSAELVTETKGRCQVKTTAAPIFDLNPTITKRRWYDSPFFKGAVVAGALFLGYEVGTHVK